MIRCSPRQKLGSLIGGRRINLFRGKGDDMSRFENFIQLSQGIIVRFTALYLLAGFLAGCATPIGVNYVDRRVAYQSLTANAISAQRASSFSARELINFNLYQEFADNPEKALAELHAGLAPKGDEDRIFALAELSFLHAQNSGERSYYLASAVYAYAFILPGERGTPPRGIDPRLRWAADLYNQSLTQAAKSDEGAYAIPMGGVFKLPFGELTVAFNERDLLWGGFRMKDFVPAADVEVRGLRNRYRTPGIGAALAASIEPIEGAAGKQTVRIPPRLKIPVTAFLRLDDPRAALASGKLRGDAGILHSGLRQNAQDRRRGRADRIRNHFRACHDSGRVAGLGFRNRRFQIRRLSRQRARTYAKDCSRCTRIKPAVHPWCSCTAQPRVRRDGPS